MTKIALEIFMLSILAGTLGSMLGLGGGIIITPTISLLLGFDIKFAFGASLISVIATSSGAAITYIKDNITNTRIGMFLEIATTSGAITGAMLSGIIKSKYLYIIFGLLLIYSGIAMLKRVREELPQQVKLSDMARKLNLNGKYFDKALGKNVEYNVDDVKSGFGVMYVAGILSGLLGIGSGVFKIMAMDIFMKLPLKVSTATSNFMMGVTAAASAGIYLMKGYIDPKIAAPVAIGVLIGSNIGTRMMQQMKSKTLRKLFIPVLFYVAFEMIMKGIKL